MMRAVLAIWKGQGHRCSGYIDDQAHVKSDREQLYQFMHNVVYPDLRKLGFLINEKKTHDAPSTNGQVPGDDHGHRSG